MSYHFFAASTSYYSGNNFQELLDEENGFGGYIYWHIGKHHVKRDDICYIYYSSLPDYSSRILFYGTVEDSDYGTNSNKSICPNPEIGEKYAKIKLKAVSIDNSSLFSFDKLRDNYQLISPRSRRISYLHVSEKNENHKRLINDIGMAIENPEKGIKEVNDYFNEYYCTCEFGCESFIEQNGFYYFERHHLVEKNLISKHKDIEGIDDLINSDRNLFKLCPNCHREIHHGKSARKKEMITKLYLINPSYFDDNFDDLKGGMNTLEWLYTLYKCDKSKI